jgi:hypothetical protein
VMTGASVGEAPKLIGVSSTRRSIAHSGRRTAREQPPLVRLRRPVLAGAVQRDAPRPVSEDAVDAVAAAPAHSPNAARRSIQAIALSSL